MSQSRLRARHLLVDRAHRACRLARGRRPGLPQLIDAGLTPVVSADEHADLHGGGPELDPAQGPR